MEQFNDVLTAIEAAVVEVAARLGPILAPIPTAYAVGSATRNALGWPATVSIVAAIVIELLGLAAVNTALMLREYNAEKRKSDPRAPFGLAAALGGVYLIVAVALAVLMDVIPSLARFSPAIFPLLSLAGVTVLGLRSDHRKRLDAIAQDKARRRKMRQERRERKRKVAQEPQEVDAQPVKAAQELTTEERRAQLLDLWRQGKAQVFAKVAPTFDVSRQTISNDFSALESEGKVKRNGDGIEVLA